MLQGSCIASLWGVSRVRCGDTVQQRQAEVADLAE